MKTKENLKNGKNLPLIENASISKLEEAGNLVCGSSQSVNNLEVRKSTIQLKSKASKFLTKEHNSLNNVIRTITENWDAEDVQNYIRDLLNSTTKAGAKRLSLHITVDDINRDDILSVLPYYTNKEGKKVFCRYGITSKNILPAKTFGNYTALNSEIVTLSEDEAKHGVIVEFKGVNSKGEPVTRTLVPLQGFTPWHILSVVVKTAQIEAKSGARKIREQKQEARKIAKENKLKIKDFESAFEDAYNEGAFSTALKFFESLDSNSLATFAHKKRK